MSQPTFRRALFTLFTLFLAAFFGSGQAVRAEDTNLHAHFPDGFQWCVATAAHQTEGGNVNSDWWDWEHTPGHIKNGAVSGAATDAWNRVDEDIALISRLGATTYRFSIEWAKVEPQQGQFDEAVIEHYKKQVESLQRAGIRPMITLHHFTFPRWLSQKGGWEWEGTPAAFARYTAVVYEEIAPNVRDWITVNEPMVNIVGGYVAGVMPPGEKRSFEGIIPVLRGLLKAHAAAYHTLHGIGSQRKVEVRVGMAHHLRVFEPNYDSSFTDISATKLTDKTWNWMIPDALETGQLELHMLWIANDSEVIPGLRHTQDFTGINYYSGDLVEFSFTGGIEFHTRKDTLKTDLGWDIIPEGMYKVVHEASLRYPKNPIIITENGIADQNDSLRPQFIVEHLAALSRAINEGAKVEGYCHWALTDNFEWNEGFTPRFGLYEVNYSTFERTLRPSGKLYQNIILNNGF